MAKSINEGISGLVNNITNSIVQNTYNSINKQRIPESELESRIDGSVRLFGMPHQFTAENDPRMGEKSDLGRCFFERMVLEAPIIALKPGLPDFLPGKSDEEKKAMANAIASNATGPLQALFSQLGADDTDDPLIYYSIKDAYHEMMSKVNIMCKLMAVFIGISGEKVPWSPNFTFGTYDWRYYSFKSVYNNTRFAPPAGAESGKNSTLGTFLKDTVNNAVERVTADTQWLRFYVDSNASFSESSSNSTTTSMLESFTKKMEGIAKELDVVTGMIGQEGVDVESMAQNATASVDQYLQDHLSADSPIAGLLKKITSNSKQILSGGNFMIPEIWSDSNYNKSYSFTITLSTPYGNPISWYLNIGVPLCHILGLCLPQQLGSNTYKSPYLVKCYSPGWFNCQYGIIDSVNIEKGADEAWSVGGFPNVVKVGLSVKDLYTTLSIPVEPNNDNITTFVNTGMLEFLMVNCGIDITHQDLDSKLKIWSTIVANNFADRITAKPIQVQDFAKRKIQKLFNVI